MNYLNGWKFLFILLEIQQIWWNELQVIVKAGCKLKCRPGPIYQSASLFEKGQTLILVSKWMILKEYSVVRYFWIGSNNDKISETDNIQEQDFLIDNWKHLLFISHVIPWNNHVLEVRPCGVEGWNGNQSRSSYPINRQSPKLRVIVGDFGKTI